MTLTISPQLLRTSIDELRTAGRAGSERVLLWLAAREAAQLHVREVFVPDQVATADYFRVPGTAIRDLARYAAGRGLFAACQVHSHPLSAFHSAADDRWALIRHVGALSLVVPSFALRTTVESFLDDVAAYALTPTNTWVERSARTVLEIGA